MTERRSPVTWRLTPRTVLISTAVAGAAFGGLLTVQAATGRDPALAAIALRDAQRAAVTPAAPARRILVRRVIVTRVVTAPAAAPVPATAPAGAPVPASSTRAPASAPPAPVAAPVAPPPPVVSSAS